MKKSPFSNFLVKTIFKGFIFALITAPLITFLAIRHQPVQDTIQLHIDSTKFDTELEYIIDTLNDGDIYTTSSFHPLRPDSLIPLRSVTVQLPKEQHCFKLSVTSILNDGTISTYSNEHCTKNYTGNITFQVKNEAINIVTVCSYNDQHYVAQKASFIIITI